MRLIDADELKTQLYESIMVNEDMGCLDFLIVANLIDAQPTAFDVDNVIDELIQRSKEYNSCVRLHGKQEEMLTDDAIEIIKQSSVSDDVCEWKVFDNSLTDEPQWVYETTCGKYVGEEHTSKAFVYCPYCGEKIKIVGD